MLSQKRSQSAPPRLQSDPNEALHLTKDTVIHKSSSQGHICGASIPLSPIALSCDEVFQFQDGFQFGDKTSLSQPFVLTPDISTDHLSTHADCGSTKASSTTSSDIAVGTEDSTSDEYAPLSQNLVMDKWLADRNELFSVQQQ